ncbi:hypothetical protein AB0E11_27595 [Streptomyces fradiae]|uniref:hypothetical protein n=1 Tax=Streptomyces fradiae TaxID=1906 RepID=UPI0033EFFDD3
MIDQPLGLTQLIAAAEAQLPDGVDAYPTQIGVFCDDCGLLSLHDYIVHTDMTRPERLQVARDHLTTNEGWDCGAAGDLCPDCKGDEPGMCPACDTAANERCVACGSCRCDRHDTCTRPA